MTRSMFRPITSSATGRQGVNYARNMASSLLVFDADSHFLIIDRKGPGGKISKRSGCPEGLRVAAFANQP